MTIDLKQLSSANIEQMAFDLKIEEVEADVSITPAEAQRRSEVALMALKDKFRSDNAAQESYEEKIRKTRFSDSDAKPVFIERPNKLYGWAEDFYRLQDHGWPWRVAAYIAWAASPKNGRYPKTQEDLALQVLGLTSDRQISKWRKNSPEIDEMIGIMQAIPLLDHRRDVFEALIASASDPSSKGAQDRKTALTMTGDYVPRQKVELERPLADPVEASDAELEEIAKRGEK